MGSIFEFKKVMSSQNNHSEIYLEVLQELKILASLNLLQVNHFFHGGI